jgi:hypothetical protein
MDNAQRSSWMSGLQKTMDIAAGPIRLLARLRTVPKVVGKSERNGISTSTIKARRKEVIDMPLLQVVIVLIVVGVLLWLVNRYIPMQSTIKSILNAVVVIAVVLWLLNLFGLFQAFSNIHVGK